MKKTRNVNMAKKKKSSNNYPFMEFENMLRMSQHGLKFFTKQKLRALGYNPVDEKGFLYAEGELPVLLVAHLDTVHVKLPTKIYRNEGKLTSPNGIGGDDRCGVYMILELVKELRCSVLFCEDEEIGAVGAELFVKSDIAKTVNPNYIIEFDRKGSNDAVFYDCDNPDFEDFITESKFFKPSWGSFSDISVIAPALKVAAVNLSCGYYNAHLSTEYIVLQDMIDAMNEAKNIIMKPSEQFEYIEAKYSYGFGGYSRGGYASITKKNNGYGGDEVIGNINPDTGTIYSVSSFTVVWYSEVWGATKKTTVYADSEVEALGYFFIENPYLMFNDVIDYYEDYEYDNEILEQNYTY